MLGYDYEERAPGEDDAGLHGAENGATDVHEPHGLKRSADEPEGLPDAKRMATSEPGDAPELGPMPDLPGAARLHWPPRQTPLLLLSPPPHLSAERFEGLDVRLKDRIVKLAEGRAGVGRRTPAPSARNLAVAPAPALPAGTSRPHPSHSQLSVLCTR
jgi:hypothetical protein